MAGLTLGVRGSQDRRIREERVLFERLAADGDARDRDALIERFLSLARSLALRYRRSGEPLDDLLQELAMRVERSADTLVEELHRQPSVAEISAAVGASEEDVLQALQACGAYRALSFDEPRAGDEDTATLGDLAGVYEYGFDRADERATLAALLTRATSREREVLRPRFEQDMTQAQIGAVIGVSQMQVSRIIGQALTRVRAGTSAAA